MTFLSELDVVNDMLATMGEAPLNALDDAHPLVPAGRRFLNTQSWRVQAKSWWFNKEVTTLSPDPSGNLFLPDDTISVDPVDKSAAYVQRGKRLYQPFASASVDKFVFTSPVVCWLVRRVPFDELPAPAQAVISLSARLDFQLLYDADPNKVALLQQDLRMAQIELNTEHIRNKGVNLLDRSQVSSAMHYIHPGANTRTPYRN